MRRPGGRSFLVDALLVTVLCAPLYLYHLDRADCTATMEALAWKSAREMHASGDWVVPTFNGAVRLQKPPLPLWEALLVARVRGTAVDLLDARIPSAVAATVTVLLTLALGRALFGRAAGLAGALFLGTSFGFVQEARMATWDIHLAASTAGAFLAFWHAHRQPRRYAASWHLFFLSLAAGLLAKGPVVLAFVCPGILLHLIVRRDLRALRRVPWETGVPLVLILVLPWPLLVVARQGLRTTLAVWSDESVADRFNDRWRLGDLPFYATTIPALLFPPVVFAVGGVACRLVRRRRDAASPGAGYLLAWFGAGFAILTASVLKRSRYALPFLPAPALLGGGLYAEMQPAKRGARLLLVLNVVVVVLGWAAAHATVFRRDLASAPGGGGARAAAIAATVLGAAAPAVLLAVFRTPARARRALLAATIVHVIAMLVLASVLLDGGGRRERNPYRPLLETLNGRVSEGDAVYLIAPERTRPHADLYAYARFPIVTWTPAGSRALPEGATPGGAYALIEASRWADLPSREGWSEIASGTEIRPGERWVVVARIR